MEKVSLVGKMVVGYCGCMHDTREGQIIAEQHNAMFGDTLVIAWDNGKLETYMQFEVKPIAKKRATGVYYL